MELSLRHSFYLLHQTCNNFVMFNLSDISPELHTSHAPGNFMPFESHTQFEVTDFIYRKTQLLSRKVNEFMELFANILPPDIKQSFTDNNHVHKIIDKIKDSNVPWQSFSASYNGMIPKNGTLLP